MKKILVLLVALILVFVSVGISEDVPFSEWIAGQDRVVADVFVGEVAAPEVPAPEAPVPEAPAFEPIGVGSRGETVAQLQAKLIELGILNSKADGIFGAASEAAVKYTQKALGWEETGVIQTEDELNTILALVPGDGVNLALGTSNKVLAIPYGVEAWCLPSFYNTSARGLALLGDKLNEYFTVSFDWSVIGADAEVDASICLKQTENTYTTVGNFHIAMGDSSGHYCGAFIPTEGMRMFGKDWIISGAGKGGINRNMTVILTNFKFERGITATEWTSAPEDIGDGVNLSIGTNEAVSVNPSGVEQWCLPSFYHTSEKGLDMLGDTSNAYFTVSFDWSVTGADAEVDASICLRQTENTYAAVGNFHIAVGDSSGHYSGAFIPTEGMRMFGKDWIISGAGEGSINRNMTVLLTAFKFERGITATEWTIAPEEIDNDTI